MGFIIWYYAYTVSGFIMLYDIIIYCEVTLIFL